jgi:hypothetical protein
LPAGPIFRFPTSLASSRDTPALHLETGIAL